VKNLYFFDQKYLKENIVELLISLETETGICGICSVYIISDLFTNVLFDFI